jgi:hypothetical protein
VRQVPAGIGRQRVRKRYLTALREELAKLGWIEGRNLRIDLRVTGGDADRTRAYAIELVGLAPDVIVASSRPTATAVQERTKTIPIVFTAGGDPATTGVVKNITHPRGQYDRVRQHSRFAHRQVAGVAQGGRSSHHESGARVQPAGGQRPLFPSGRGRRAHDSACRRSRPLYAIFWKWCVRSMHSRPSRTGLAGCARPPQRQLPGAGIAAIDPGPGLFHYLLDQWQRLVKLLAMSVQGRRWNEALGRTWRDLR